MFTSTFTPTIESAHILPILELGEVPKSLEHRTIIQGQFNGQDFCLSGGGQGSPHEGTLSCKLSSTTGPVPFPMQIMNVIAIFGYPTYSKHINVFDIFKRSNGYEYELNIEFENGGHLHSLHIVRYDDIDGKRYLSGTFHVNAHNVQAPDDITNLSPILETFVPAGKGKVRSKFILNWNTSSGKPFLASCESEYRLRHQLELPQVMFRFAEFLQDRSTDEVLDLDERIWVADHFSQKSVAA